jgi:hypothetical protein
MMADGVSALGKESEIAVRDIAELTAAAMRRGGSPSGVATAASALATAGTR